jgi:hypothetical protein
MHASHTGRKAWKKLMVPWSHVQINKQLTETAYTCIINKPEAATNSINKN